MNEFQIDQLIEASNLTSYITALFNLMSIYSLLLEENNVQSLDLCVYFLIVFYFLTCILLLYINIYIYIYMMQV